MLARILFGLAGALTMAAAARAGDEVERMLAAAHAQVGVTVAYAPAYVRLAYPGGDLPPDRGVCSDVIVRAMRAVGIDLQVDVHRDMRAHFAAYPAYWGLTRPDPNIDHRRVPNLERYFQRLGKALPPGADAQSFLPGDFVSWRLDGGQPHIGIVSGRRSADRLRPLVIHNIGAGTQVEDVLFEWKMTGHFRYFAEPAGTAAPPAPPVS
ncbi:MAG TPA: DUF1287 domain-containing protein [Dokdonella sp.]|nr:DUF1287 domain-containing protein [Dokdonella sp.]